MPLDEIFAVSRSGLEHQRLRLEVAARNIAIANTAQTPGAAPAAQRVSTSTSGDFAATLGTPTLSVTPDTAPARLVHDPAHPQADAAGMVHYPAVDVATEMTTLVSAGRAYEANVRAMNALRSMLVKALELGGK